MSGQAKDYWERANTALKSARILLPDDPDGASSRAYYAAFYAFSAVFALRGKTFSKHSAIASAVHRELVKGDGWPASLGESFSSLSEIRTTADYGNTEHASVEDAQGAIEAVESIFVEITTRRPELKE